jgi:hypothetical protein
MQSIVQDEVEALHVAGRIGGQMAAERVGPRWFQTSDHRSRVAAQRHLIEGGPVGPRLQFMAD